MGDERELLQGGFPFLVPVVAVPRARCLSDLPALQGGRTIDSLSPFQAWVVLSENSGLVFLGAGDGGGRRTLADTPPACAAAGTEGGSAGPPPMPRAWSRGCYGADQITFSSLSKGLWLLSKSLMLGEPSGSTLSPM